MSVPTTFNGFIFANGPFDSILVGNEETNEGVMDYIIQKVRHSESCVRKDCLGVAVHDLDYRRSGMAPYASSQYSFWAKGKARRLGKIGRITSIDTVIHHGGKA